MKKSLCPCGTGAPYAACCEPFHRGRAEPPDAEALMRSRYAAFALKEADYLWKTLHADHDDRARSREELVRAVKNSRLRYMGLQILDRHLTDPPGPAQVLFLAKVFDKGRDLSFVELSDFLHDGEGWRYLTGISRPLGAIPGDPTKLILASFPP